MTVTCNGRTLTKGTDYTLDYRNNKAIGTGYVYIYGTGNYTGSMIKTFKILGKDISSLTGTLSQTSYKYTGLENKPTVTLYDGTTKLTLGTDYTVAYKDNKNCGTATVTITGKGNYSGTKTLNFTIVGQEQTLTTKYNIYSKTLSSKAFDLGASTDGDGKLTYSSSDTSVATVSDKGIVTVRGTGIAYITIKTTGDAKYNPATKTVTIKVKPATPKATLTSTAKGKAKVTLTKVSGATKYQVQYGRMGNYKNKYITHKDNTYTKTSTTLTSLKSGKTYYVKVRAYKTLADGTKVYGAWSTTQKIKVK